MDLSIHLNAWTGLESASGLVDDPARWALRRELEAAPRLLAPHRIDLADWKDPCVGWGVVLADGAPIPPALQQLITERKGPVFRYVKGAHEFVLLRNYQAGKDLDINGSGFGTKPDSLPFYLLIYGTPEQVPWKLQYVLNANRAVGRLTLEGKPLENYVNALLSGKWGEGEASDPLRSVVWAVQHEAGDITELMRNALAEKLVDQLRGDDQLAAGVRFLDGAASPAQVTELISRLKEDRPGLIVTTSHGMTGPLHDPAAMLRQLGLPVDHEGKTLTPENLLAAWQPAGAIWYAHACCSAGGDSESRFVELVGAGSTAGKVLAGVAALGAQTAPLPTALLGAEHPLRAFIGHVEPTFDWTLQQPATGQFLTARMVDALYQHMYVAQGERELPIGYAFREWYGRTNGLRSAYDAAFRKFNTGEDMDKTLAALQLAARDVESTVILGDPTAAMPALAQP